MHGALYLERAIRISIPINPVRSTSHHLIRYIDVLRSLTKGFKDKCRQPVLYRKVKRFTHVHMCLA